MDLLWLCSGTPAASYKLKLLEMEDKTILPISSCFHHPLLPSFSDGWICFQKVSEVVAKRWREGLCALALG